jgi:predicted P-loop ATPase
MSKEDELRKVGVNVQPPILESDVIIAHLKDLGYTFRINECADTLEVNGYAITDEIKAEIRMKLRDTGYAKKIAAAEDAYLAHGKRNGYHPIRDYLDALKCDGVDHIGALAGFMSSSDPPVVYKDGTSLPLHHAYLYRWLVGAVMKIYSGAQNPMMVWDSVQGLGKSTLAHWLCPLPNFFLEGAINVQDKDSDIRLLSNWIWEVSELDATTRKADQSALKAFITKEVVTVRKSYGRHDTKKPALASLIGTVNNTSGFLADESGSRRFMITRLTRIDLAYQKLDIHQLWAQAYQLYLDGETNRLTPEEAAAQRAVNERYEVETVLSDWIDKYFDFHPDYDDRYSMADVITAMQIDGMRLTGSERSQAMELSRVLIQRGAKKVHDRGGNRWVGLFKKPR